jgi:DNA-binding response OmpR family regulator
MRILIVEDDPLVAMTAAAVLTEAGHSVIGPAYGVAEAWDLIAEETPDLALVDINLDGQDEGIGLAAAFKDGRQLPTLWVSGQVAVARRHRGHAMGLLLKPYAPKALTAAAAVAQAILTGCAPLPPRLPPSLELFQT